MSHKRECVQAAESAAEVSQDVSQGDEASDQPKLYWDEMDDSQSSMSITATEVRIRSCTENRLLGTIDR